MAAWIVLIAMTAVFAIALVTCFIEKTRRLTGKKDVVGVPEAGFRIAALIGGACLALAWFFACYQGKPNAAMWLSAASLAGTFLLLNWEKNTFTFDDKGFTRNSLFGKPQRYTYDQVSGWHEDIQMPGIVFLHVNGKKAAVNKQWVNAEALLDAVRENYSKKRDDQEFPEVSMLKEGGKGFAAHVYRPQDYYLRFGILIVVIASFCVISVMGACKTADPEKLYVYETVFYEWETRNSKLVLRDAEVSEEFWIYGYADCAENYEKIMQRIDTQKPLAVLFKYKETAIDEPHYRVFAIASDEEVYMTIEEANRYDRTLIPYIIGVAGAILAVILAVFGLYYAVGSNPARYPEWLVYRLFKKDKIKI